MKKREELLREEYEDAALAMILHELAKEEGSELLRQNEQLKNDPSFVVPKSTTQRSLETIQKTFASKKRAKAFGVARKALVKAACIAAIAGLMTASAYAVFPKFRRATNNLLIEAEEIATRLKLGKDRDTCGIDIEQTPEVEPKVLMGYVIPEVPDGFMLDGVWEDDKSAWIQYKNKAGAKIKFGFSSGTYHAIDVDTEDAHVQKIQVQNMPGLLSVEEEAVQIAWNDTETGVFILVWGEHIDAELIQTLANGVVLEK